MTLDVGLHLWVEEKRGDWLLVTVGETGDRGWVHGAYTSPEPQSLGSKEKNDFRLSPQTVGAFVSLLGGLLLCSLLGKLFIQAPYSETLRHYLAATTLGFGFLANQYGLLFAQIFPRWTVVEALAPLWRFDDGLLPAISPGMICLTMVGLALSSLLVSPNDGSRRSLLQGWLTGFLLVPVLLAASFVVALAFFLLSIILSFLAIPFIWLWDHFLSEIAAWLNRGFRRLWSFLAPVFEPIYEYFLKPATLFIIRITITAITIGGLTIYGTELLEAIRGSFRRPLDTLGLFSHGFNTGFVTANAALLWAISRSDTLPADPSITLCFTLLLPIVVFVRLLAPRTSTDTATRITYETALRHHWVTSKLQMAVSVFQLLLRFLLGPDDSD